MLIQETFFGKVDKVAIALARLREFVPEEGYYFCNSGGKDSTVCRDLLIRSGVKFDAHFSRAVEPPEVHNFIRENHPETQIHLPAVTIWESIVKNGTPPTRQMRYCCRDAHDTRKDDGLVLFDDDGGK